MDGIDTWPPLPEGVTGQEIRYRQICDGFVSGSVRLGALEPKAILAETADYIIYAAYSHPDGRKISEAVLSRAQFNERFERRYGKPKKYRPVKHVQKTRVYVGETDITRHVESVGIERRAGRVDTAKVTVFIEPLHVDADGTLIITIPEET